MAYNTLCLVSKWSEKQVGLIRVTRVIIVFTGRRPRHHTCLPSRANSASLFPLARLNEQSQMMDIKEHLCEVLCFSASLTQDNANGLRFTIVFLTLLVKPPLDLTASCHFWGCEIRLDLRFVLSWLHCLRRFNVCLHLFIYFSWYLRTICFSTKL